jgi:hypothetical protein
VERTFSEHMSSELTSTLVSAADSLQSTSLPDELKQGAILAAYNAAFTASGSATTDYADGTPPRSWPSPT